MMCWSSSTHRNFRSKLILIFKGMIKLKFKMLPMNVFNTYCSLWKCCVPVWIGLLMVLIIFVRTYAAFLLGHLHSRAKKKKFSEFMRFVALFWYMNTLNFQFKSLSRSVKVDQHSVLNGLNQEDSAIKW